MDLHARAPGAHVSDCAHVRDVGFPRPGRPGDAGPILPVLQLMSSAFVRAFVL